MGITVSAPTPRKTGAQLMEEGLFELGNHSVPNGQHLKDPEAAGAAYRGGELDDLGMRHVELHTEHCDRCHEAVFGFRQPLIVTEPDPKL